MLPRGSSKNQQPTPKNVLFFLASLLISTSLLLTSIALSPNYLFVFVIRKCRKKHFTVPLCCFSTACFATFLKCASVLLPTSLICGKSFINIRKSKCSKNLNTVFVCSTCAFLRFFAILCIVG